jgi:lysophospholipase L1-like esterase
MRAGIGLRTAVAVLLAVTAAAGVLLAACNSRAAPAADPSSRVDVAFIGDSYTQGGPRQGIGERRWSALLTARLEQEGNPIRARVQAIPGSGYVNGATARSFAQMVPIVVTPSTGLVVLFGSRNDAGLRRVDQAATETFNAIRAIAPEAEILVVGPPWVDASPTVPIKVARDYVATAARQAEVRFVDPIAEGWFAGPEPGLIDVDGVHPTDAGHAYIADRIFPHVRDALLDIRTARRPSS